MNKYKFSHYNFLFEAAGKKYIYNTLSTAMAELDEQTALAIDEGDMSRVKAEYCSIMKDQHFLVDQKANETDEYFYFYDRTRFGKSSESLSINFIPSYNCNLACPYCLQGQKKENKSISNEDVNRILVFMESHIINSKNDIPVSKIFIHLYGGEPMMQKDALFLFSDSVYQIAQRYGCQIVYSMTSNLTLLDDAILELMKKYRINTQVSIDGTKTQHDTRRIKKNGGGTYDTILNNLQRLNDSGLKDCVTIRLNIDKNNLNDADEIMRAVRAYSDDVYFGFLDTFTGFNDSFSEICVSSEIYPQVVSQKFNEIYRKYDFEIPLPFGKMPPCSINSENKFFIDCYLNVYKCEMLLNQPNARVGHIADDGTFIVESGFYHQMNRSPKIFADCYKCKLLPLCAGGCAGKVYIANNRNNGILDEKYCMFTEESLISYLQDYAKRLV
jgi:uncharacterized protein